MTSPSVAALFAYLVVALFVSSANAADTSLCCGTTDYSSNWKNCPNAADPNAGKVTSCSQCRAYSCLDWTAGSNEMTSRQNSFKQRTGNDVIFGVGSYGNKQSRAGNCYRFTAAGVNKDLIVQVVNQGGDVADGNFDLLESDGGFGVYNACVAGSTNVPQYSGTTAQWGNQYGGWYSASGCSKLPAYPICSSGSSSNNNNLQTMCEWSFDEDLRTNPTITNMCQVSCPSELWQATGLHRSDEPVKNTYTCGSSNPGVSNGGEMTRMMDCAKPSYGWASNVKGSTFKGYEQVIPCRRDGYTRINAKTKSTASTSGSTSDSSNAAVVDAVVGVIAGLIGVGILVAIGWYYFYKTRATSKETDDLTKVLRNEIEM